jgi:LAS superfamily LD-carboxypeptidase LdcB
MLNSLELTGRAATHVRERADWACTLNEPAGEALVAMREAARAAGMELDVVSGFRDFKRQVAIWNGKFSGERALLDRMGREIARESLDESGMVDAILIWSALPGASRHHWGTEIDVIDAECLHDAARPQLVPAEFAAGGCFARLEVWLRDNMRRFGFFRPYATDRGGVQPEPWHLSYGAVSRDALAALSVEVLREAIVGSDMLGRENVLLRLEELYRRYVVAVDES